MGSAATGAEEVSRPVTEEVGSGTNLQLAFAEQEDEQRLRALVRDERGHDLRADEPPDGKEARPYLTLLAQFLVMARFLEKGK